MALEVLQSEIDDIGRYPPTAVSMIAVPRAIKIAIEESFSVMVKRGDALADMRLSEQMGRFIHYLPHEAIGGEANEILNQNYWLNRRKLVTQTGVRWDRDLQIHKL